MSADELWDRRMEQNWAARLQGITVTHKTVIRRCAIVRHLAGRDANPYEVQATCFSMQTLPDQSVSRLATYVRGLRRLNAEITSIKRVWRVCREHQISAVAIHKSLEFAKAHRDARNAQYAQYLLLRE